MPHGNDQTFRHQSSGSLNIPTGSMAAIGMQGDGTLQGRAEAGGAAAGQAFDGPRSPPGKQSEHPISYMDANMSTTLWQRVKWQRSEMVGE